MFSSLVSCLHSPPPPLCLLAVLVDCPHMLEILLHRFRHAALVLCANLLGHDHGLLCHGHRTFSASVWDTRAFTVSVTTAVWKLGFWRAARRRRSFLATFKLPLGSLMFKKFIRFRNAFFLSGRDTAVRSHCGNPEPWSPFRLWDH